MNKKRGLKSASELHIHTKNTMKEPLITNANPKQALIWATNLESKESLSKVASFYLVMNHRELNECNGQISISNIRDKNDKAKCCSFLFKKCL